MFIWTAAGESFEAALGTVLVTGRGTRHGLVGGADAVLIADGLVDDGLDEDPGEDERKHSCKRRRPAGRAK